MTLMAKDSLRLIPDQVSQDVVSRRDAGIDTMRGIAILMVIGIHSLQQPLNSWQTLADAPLRPCVPIFLFASGYLTALSGRVPLWKRLKAVLIPYMIAFVAAYIYMTLRNPAMDHHLATTLARFVFAYVFVYYYVFVYVGCTIALWLVFSASECWLAAIGTEARRLSAALNRARPDCRELSRPAAVPPRSFRHLIEEVRMRDIPFWFSFMALGTLLGIYGTRSSLRDMRVLMSGATLFAFLFYASVRLFGLGDAADYDSIAFFGYAALLCILLFTRDIQLPWLAALGSGSYFIYLWHIFIVMFLRDHVGLKQFDPATSFAISFTVAAFGSILALLTVRAIAPPYLIRWLGA